MNMNRQNEPLEKITAVRLRLELRNEYLSDENRRMMKRYGESLDGESITRDILIPSDMPLHHLHYAIQKLFGWQNSHLRCFMLPEERFQFLTGGTVRGWTELVGELFQPPSEHEEDIFWDDHYDGGNFFTWMRKKYTGPYEYGGRLEIPQNAQKDVRELLDRFKMVDVRETFQDFMERTKNDEEPKYKILRSAPLIDLTLEELQSSIMLEGRVESLLERLPISRILADECENLDTEEFYPVTREILYNYDYGDDWNITITKHKDSSDLLDSNLIGEDELQEATDSVIRNYRPVCIHKQGISVLDDVGGLRGFSEFLGTIYEGPVKGERAEYRAWAKSLGWSEKKISCKEIL